MFEAVLFGYHSIVPGPLYAQSTRGDFKKQLSINEAWGFLGMFGSLDCMHWKWRKSRLHSRVILEIEMAGNPSFLKP